MDQVYQLGMYPYTYVRHVKSKLPMIPNKYMQKAADNLNKYMIWKKKASVGRRHQTWEICMYHVGTYLPRYQEKNKRQKMVG